MYYREKIKYRHKYLRSLIMSGGRGREGGREEEEEVAVKEERKERLVFSSLRETINAGRLLASFTKLPSPRDKLFNGHATSLKRCA